MRGHKFDAMRLLVQQQRQGSSTQQRDIVQVDHVKRMAFQQRSQRLKSQSGAAGLMIPECGDLSAHAGADVVNEYSLRGAVLPFRLRTSNEAKGTGIIRNMNFMPAPQEGVA